MTSRHSPDRGPLAMPRRSRAGFTLVELLVVVLIMAVLGGVAGLSSSGDNAQQALQLAALQVDDAVSRAQSLARSNRAPFGVVFELGGTRLSIVDQAGDEVIDPLTRQDYIVDFSLPGQPGPIVFSAVDFGATGSAVIFDPQGQPLADGGLTLARNGHTLALSVDAATGRLLGY